MQKIGALWRSRRCLCLGSRIQYVRSAIMPDLLHGSNAFSSSVKASQLDRLPVMQNQAARAVYGLPSHLCSASARTHFPVQSSRVLRPEATHHGVALCQWESQQCPPGSILTISWEHQPVPGFQGPHCPLGTIRSRQSSPGLSGSLGLDRTPKECKGDHGCPAI